MSFTRFKEQFNDDARLKLFDEIAERIKAAYGVSLIGMTLSLSAAEREESTRKCNTLVPFGWMDKAEAEEGGRGGVSIANVALYSEDEIDKFQELVKLFQACTEAQVSSLLFEMTGDNVNVNVNLNNNLNSESAQGPGLGDQFQEYESEPELAMKPEYAMRNDSRAEADVSLDLGDIISRSV